MESEAKSRTETAKEHRPPTVRGLVIRLLIIMSMIFCLALLAIASINTDSRRNYWSLVENNQRYFSWIELYESANRELLSTGIASAPTRTRLETQPLPFDCCEAQRTKLVDVVSQPRGEENMSDYSLSTAWTNLATAQRLALRAYQDELRAEIGLRNWLIPVLAILSLMFSLFVTWSVVRIRLIEPAERLSRYVTSVLRGRPSGNIELSGAVRELGGFNEAFELTVADYRAQLLSQGARSQSLASESDLLEMQIQSLVEGYESPAFVIDVAGNVRTWNRRMIELTGIPRGQANKLLFSDSFVAAPSQALFENALQEARQGTVPDLIKCSMLRQNKTNIDVELLLSPQLEPGVGVNRVLGLIRAEELLAKSSADEVEKTLATSKEIKALRRSLSANFSNHEDASKDELSRRLSAVMLSVEWLGAQPATGTEFDAAEVVSHIVAVSRPTLLEQDIDLVAADGSPEAKIKGSAGDLVATLNQVVANASEAIANSASSTRRITISAGFGADRDYDIVVVDTGCGIPKDQIDQVFDPLFTTKASSGHLGMGLTLSRSLIKAMGGAMTLRASSGTPGCQVTISLPLCAD